MTALQTQKSQLKQRFISELREHVEGMCVIWCTAWEVSTSASSCIRTKCSDSDATTMSSAFRCTV